MIKATICIIEIFSLFCFMIFIYDDYLLNKLKNMLTELDKEQEELIIKLPLTNHSSGCQATKQPDTT